MIVATATLIFLTLVFAPIYLKANVTFVASDMSAQVSIGVGFVKVFDERVSLRGRFLHCEGTVESNLDVRSIDGKSGIALLGCLTVDKLCVTLYSNFASFACLPALNAILATATTTAINLFHCQLYSEVLGTLGKSRMQIRALINLSVVGLSFCLLKQGVKKWKTRKSEK